MSKETDAGKNIVEKIKRNKKLQYLLVAIFSIIIIFIFLSNFVTKESVSESSLDIDNYVSRLENNLEKALNEVDGAGKVSVVITVESGMETVLAMETIENQTSSGTEIKKTPIIVNGKPIVLKEKYPKIIGVLIVAEGAKNIATLTKIQQATKSLLDINVNQIEILTMK